MFQWKPTPRRQNEVDICADTPLGRYLIHKPPHGRGGTYFHVIHDGKIIGLHSGLGDAKLDAEHHYNLKKGLPHV